MPDRCPKADTARQSRPTGRRRSSGTAGSPGDGLLLDGLPGRAYHLVRRRNAAVPRQGQTGGGDALDGVVDKLESGATVADVGCGHGASTIVMAEAYPASRFVGFDFHEASIEAARERAAAAGVDGRVSFEQADATSFDAHDLDLV